MNKKELTDLYPFEHHHKLLSLGNKFHDRNNPHNIPFWTLNAQGAEAIDLARTIENQLTHITQEDPGYFSQEEIEFVEFWLGKIDDQKSLTS